MSIAKIKILKDFKEEIILKQLKKSDNHALKMIFEYFYNSLCRFAYIILQSKETAEDVVQNTLIHLWEWRENLTIQNNLKAYLFITVKNKAINQMKADKIRKQHENSYINTFRRLDENDLYTDNFTEKLHKAIQQLPEQCRIIYTLKNLEGLTYREISEYLQVSEKTVENQINIALKKLREILIKYRVEYYSI